MGTVSTGSAEHYRWGQGCDGWHLLAGDDLSVIEERMPPGTWEVRHRHACSRQFFYVLQGELTLELEGTSHRLATGHGLHVPPGAAHQVRNDSGAEVRMLVVSSPRSHGDRIDAPLEANP
ncbi:MULTISPECIES: cupin domain-containing protein [unclassified Dyella]|uniref:cupin domain-containing protein n=1 Tax=unclassified Dyella TaxID=2634549 RepID=UPI000C81A92B|nr:MULTISPECIES: cupin domain-containing protein [unclassified Dyella]MDR3448074.1 cupin domain-containing protein [Dyella sp.]PMQ05527.1 Quercetin 2,3-dioxygenase [Dyella sp. AD56]